MKHLKTFESYESLELNPRWKLLGFLRKYGKLGIEWLKREIMPLPAGKIRARDAYTSKGSMMTVIKGKRDVGFGCKVDFNDGSKDYWMSEFNKKGIKVMKVNVKDVSDNPYGPFIYYRDTPEAYKKALELKGIAERFNGYLSYEADKPTTKRIGELLGYSDYDLKSYLD